jgi:hypothetical protein
MLEHIYELLHDYQTYVRRKSETGIMNWPVNPSGVARWLEITILEVGIRTCDISDVRLVLRIGSSF